jgi:hypothetical protein
LGAGWPAGGLPAGSVRIGADAIVGVGGPVARGCLGTGGVGGGHAARGRRACLFRRSAAGAWPGAHHVRGTPHKSHNLRRTSAGLRGAHGKGSMTCTGTALGLRPRWRIRILAFRRNDIVFCPRVQLVSKIWEDYYCHPRFSLRFRCWQVNCNYFQHLLTVTRRYQPTPYADRPRGDSTD